MNKLTKYEYIQLIVYSMTKEYGGTLSIHNTDIKMADTVLKNLKPYLHFREHTKKDYSDYHRWLKTRNRDDK